MNQKKGVPARGWRAAVALLALALLPGCAALDEWQRRKIYRPTGVDASAWQALQAGRPDVEVRRVAVRDEQVQLLRLPARPGQVSTVQVLFLHGTYRHAFQNLAKAEPMRRAGLDVWLPDYRGWGASSPRLPSEQSIHEDAWSVWQALQAGAAISGPAPRWVIYGHSMGSAVAVQLAWRLRGTRSHCALVLESAFTRFSDVAAEGAGVLGRLLTAAGSQRMDSAALIGEVAPPVWFLHGSRDDTVPPALGRRLYEMAPEPRHWVQWPLGHSDLHTDPGGDYDRTWQAIRSACKTAP